MASAETNGRHPGWVRGVTVRAPGEVVPFLRDGAQHRARRALRAYKTTDPWKTLDAAADAGTAVELLAKSCIAVVEPALLAKGGSGLTVAASVLRLRGHGQVLGSPSELRTVTLDATTAVEIAQTLFPKLRSAATGARAALEARNDSLHMGIAVPSHVETAVEGMASYVKLALPILDVEPSRFWGDDEAEASRAVGARTTYVAEVVEAKIEYARTRHAQLALKFGEEEVAALVASRVAMHAERTEGQPGFVEQCPACDSPGWIDVDFDFDVDPDGEGDFTYFQTDSWVAGFTCPVCKLTLGAEECEEAGLGSTVDDDRE